MGTLRKRMREADLSIGLVFDLANDLVPDLIPPPGLQERAMDDTISREGRLPLSTLVWRWLSLTCQRHCP